MFIIALNMGTMMLQYYGQSQRMDQVLDILLVWLRDRHGNWGGGGGGKRGISFLPTATVRLIAITLCHHSDQ